MSNKNNNMKIWDQVCQTEPKYTRKVNQRGGFTAIGAQSQVQKATEIFGAMGTGWGIEEERIDRWREEGLVVYQATLWYLSNDKSKQYIPIHSAIKYNVSGRVDDDFFNDMNKKRHSLQISPSAYRKLSRLVDSSGLSYT